MRGKSCKAAASLKDSRILQWRFILRCKWHESSWSYFQETMCFSRDEERDKFEVQDEWKRRCFICINVWVNVVRKEGLATGWEQKYQATTVALWQRPTNVPRISPQPIRRVVQSGSTDAKVPGIVRYQKYIKCCRRIFGSSDVWRNKPYNAEHHTSRLQFQYAKLSGSGYLIHNNYHEIVDKVTTRNLLLIE